ncbi:type I restriction/modification specificity protein [Moraxella macacae 0408225]|uniref:Type I restriction/modification specificity protein n=1 Tax=Moraxella macacae 0408225 TaxID=1230338 RepID=L2F5G2_9GAMM|nr:restriction endonuclease subunit S [Moraxella macacae]ELA08021.1 type I restriction/modification specificity protein [Moraxella macacae 0408225]
MIGFLEKLLNGRAVEWKTLNEVSELKRGKTITAKTATKGNIPVISGGQKPAYFTGDFNRDGETITIAGSGSAGFVMYWNEPIFVSDAFSIKPHTDVLITKYVYHYLLLNQEKIFAMKKGAGIPHVYPKDVGAIKIPIPPIDVQTEIVKILDKFTALNSELIKELILRKKQYDYYLNSLLNNSSNFIALGQIGEVRMCKRILKAQTNSIGDIPFYKIGTFGKKADAFIAKELFLEYKQKYNFPKKGDILISASGTIGRTVIFDGIDAYFQDSNIVWLENDETQVLNRFLYYAYKIVEWGAVEGGTIKRLYNDNLRKITIPLLPLSEQQKIVSILDKFETLTNSISHGLPKEINLRQKQYEYYREQLLAFDNSF